jgi:hypothetical protein
MPEQPTTSMLLEIQMMDTALATIAKANAECLSEYAELLAKYNALEGEAHDLRDIVNSYYLECSRLLKIGGSMAHIKEVQKQAEEVAPWLVEKHEL